MSAPIVFSMTAFQHYKRCRKLFQLADVRNLVPKRDKVEASVGRQFHEILAAFAENVQTPGTHTTYPHKGEPIYEVAKAYLQRNGFPKRNEILAVEESFFYEVIPPRAENVHHEDFGGFYVRCTFDLAYKRADEPWVSVKDYKTFAKAPSFGDFDLDFQARTYLVCAEQHFQSECAFEWDYVRQELGRHLKQKGEMVYTEWTDEERYIVTPQLMLTPVERETIQQELWDVALDIVDTLGNGRYWRHDLKGGAFSCDGCFHRDLCKTEFLKGELTDDDLAELTTPYDPAERVKPQAIARDPRVRYRIANGMKPNQAVNLYYGVTGEKAATSFLIAELQKELDCVK